jgi:hypothetical protein
MKDQNSNPPARLPEDEGAIIPAGRGEILLYQTEDGRTRVECRFQDETIWLSQAMMAELYQKAVRTINEHLKDIYNEKELAPEATIRKFRIVRRELWKTRPGICPPEAGTTAREPEARSVLTAARHRYQFSYGFGLIRALDPTVAWASSPCIIGRMPMPQSRTRTDFSESVSVPSWKSA